MKLQIENKGYIVLVRCGAFFTAVGEDSFILEELFGFERICARKGICKCGIPVKSIGKYITELGKQKYSFVMYEYSKNGFLSTEEKYSLIFRHSNEKVNKQEKQADCGNCIHRNTYEIGDKKQMESIE